MQNKFKKFSIYLSIVVFLTCIFVFWFLYSRIQIKNIASEKILTDWKTEELRRNEIKTIMKSVEKIQKDNELIQKHFAYGSNLVPFLDTIDDFAPKVGVEDEVISVDILPDTQELVVGIKILGSFEGIYRFLTLLENSPYEIEFIGIDIQKSMSQNSVDKSTQTLMGTKSEKTGKIYPWEGLFKIKLLTFIP